MNKSLRVICVFVSFWMPLDRRAGGRLAVAADQGDHSVRRRQRGRRGAAAGVRASRGRTRPVDRDRKPRRRRRRGRFGAGRESRSRWLQHSRPVVGADDCAGDLSERDLRRHPGPRLGADDRIQRQRDDRAEGAALEDHPGLHRRRQGQARLDLVRFGRHRQRRAYQHREIPLCRRHRGHACALSRGPGSDRRHPRRADRPVFLPARDRAAADPRGPGPRAGGLDGQSASPICPTCRRRSRSD